MAREVLAELLRKLRCNKAKIPLEQLKTRYKKSYHELLVQIKTTTEAYIGEVVFQGKKPKTWATVTTIRASIEDRNYAGAISHALYSDMDMNKVDAILAQMRELVDQIILFEEQTLQYEQKRLANEGVDVGMITYVMGK